MPVALIDKKVKEGKGSRRELEAKWSKAKAQASQEGKGGNYAYITTIFQSMTGDKKANYSGSLRYYVRTKIAATEASMEQQVQPADTPEDSMGTNPDFFSNSNESQEFMQPTPRVNPTSTFPGSVPPPTPPQRSHTANPIDQNMAFNTNQYPVGTAGTVPQSNYQQDMDPTKLGVNMLRLPLRTAELLKALRITDPKRLSKIMENVGPTIMLEYILEAREAVTKASEQADLKNKANAYINQKPATTLGTEKLSHYELMEMAALTVLGAEDKTAGIGKLIGKGAWKASKFVGIPVGGAAIFSTMEDPESIERHGFAKTFGQKMLSPRTWAYGAGMSVGANIIPKIGTGLLKGAGKVTGSKGLYNAGKVMAGDFSRAGFYKGLSKGFNKIGLTGTGAKMFGKAENIANMEKLVTVPALSKALKNPGTREFLTSSPSLGSAMNYTNKFSRPSGATSKTFFKPNKFVNPSDIEGLRLGAQNHDVLNILKGRASRFGGVENMQKLMRNAGPAEKFMDVRNVSKFGTNVFAPWNAPALAIGSGLGIAGPWSPATSFVDSQSSLYDGMRGPVWEPFESHYKYNPYRAT